MPLVVRWAFVVFVLGFRIARAAAPKPKAAGASVPRAGFRSPKGCLEHVQKIVTPNVEPDTAPGTFSAASGCGRPGVTGGRHSRRRSRRVPCGVLVTVVTVWSSW